MPVVRNIQSRIKDIRPLTKDDIGSLQEISAKVRIQKLRSAHHVIARLIASGLKGTEVAREVGYSIVRVQNLTQAPAMQELIAQYRSIDTSEWAKSRDLLYESIHSAGAKAWRQINDQLEEAEDSNTPIPLQRLIPIANSVADRVGYHRKSATLNVNIDYATKLEAAIARSKQIPLIDSEVLDVAE